MHLNSILLRALNDHPAVSVGLLFGAASAGKAGEDVGHVVFLPRERPRALAL